MRTRLFSAHSGMKICVREWSPDRPIACVMIHGLGDGGFVFYPFVREISAHFRTVVIDLRGHGDSEWDGERRYSLDDYSNDVHAILEELHLWRYFLIGHSLGGDVVAKIVNSLPGIRGVIFVDTGPTTNDEVRVYLRERIVDSYRAYASAEEYSDRLAEGRIFADTKVLSELAGNALSRSGSGFKLKFDLAVADILLHKTEIDWWWPVLAEMSVPTLVMRGYASSVLPSTVAERMVRHLRFGNLAIVATAGHSVMVDNPNDFLSLTMSFLLSRA